MLIYKYHRNGNVLVDYPIILGNLLLGESIVERMWMVDGIEHTMGISAIAI